MSSWRVASMTIVAIFLWGTPTWAADWTIGGGVGWAPDYQGSDDYEAVPIALLRWEQKKGRFFEAGPTPDIGGLGARLNLLGSDEPLILGPIVNYRERRSDVDDDAVDSLDSVGTSWELGGFIGLRSESWNLVLQAVQDAADGHDGALVSLGGGYDSTLWGGWDDWNFGIRGHGSWASDDYMDSYFSISGSDSVRSGLRTFEADAGLLDVGGDLSLSRAIFSNWSLTGLFSYARLLNDAEDSPVTDDAGSADQFFAGGLLSYHF